MSDNPQDADDQSSQVEPKSEGRSHKGLYIVIGIIAVGVAAFSYDTFVVPGTVQAGFDKVANAKLKSLAEEKTLSKTEVREVLGKEPAETYEKDGAYFEVFRWTGGMVFNSHKLYTVYEKQGDDWIFDYHTLNPQETNAETFKVVKAPEGGDVEDDTEGNDTAGNGPTSAEPDEEQPENGPETTPSEEG